MTLPGLADVAAGYAEAAVAAVRREYPNGMRHALLGPDDRPTPREAHPAFYGCYDWHSAVEMHWALVRMLRVCPGAVPAAEVRAALDEHLRADALEVEARYLAERAGWERPYGWGWVLTLADELADWDDDDAARWSANLTPLVDVIVTGFVDWLPRSAYPHRGGAHANSAFALSRALPWARRRAAAGDSVLLDAISEAAVRWFASDVEYPANWEPSQDDFLSPALAEAELLAAIGRPAEAFPQWLSLFLPGLADGVPESLFTPVLVTDPEDGQGAHLHGLNLYRAYAFGLLAEHLSDGDPRRAVLRTARNRHAAASLPAVVGGGWMTEHWLACYAVLLLG
ncbi:DUF2891 domain-containing protein [uncultured Jatrophihabitans sp.]|uniref:DUF2891 domain-containing protein n=1 Tax=uncultured Jatrophihabitans sp. TaxID=1610747 RepID=UPI0035CAF8A2